MKISVVRLLLLPLLLSLSLPVATLPAAETEKDIADIIDGPRENYVRARDILEYANPNKLYLHSSHALVMDQREGVILYSKGKQEPRPIASISKLMTAMVVLDAKQDLDEKIRITRADRDRLRGSRSRLPYGTELTRRDLLKITLAASDNRASKALARTYPGGRKAFINMLNARAKQLGMTETQFRDASGLRSENVSTPYDLARLVAAAYRYPLIREFSTLGKGHVTNLRNKRRIEFFNTNRLVRRSKWDIGLSKTGYIADAGHCLVMQTDIGDRPVIIVLLNSWGKLSKFGDSGRIRKWLMQAERKAKRLASLDNLNG